MKDGPQHMPTLEDAGELYEVLVAEIPMADGSRQVCFAPLESVRDLRSWPIAQFEKCFRLVLYRMSLVHKSNQLSCDMPQDSDEWD